MASRLVSAGGHGGKQLRGEDGMVAQAVTEDTVAAEPAPGVAARDAPSRHPSAGRVAVWSLAATGTAVAVVALALALWKLKLVLGLLFLAVTIAAAMRPGVEALARRRIPRGISIILHYVALLGVVAALLAFVVPPLVTQVQEATGQGLAAGTSSDSLKGRILAEIDDRLQHLPSGREVLDPAISAGEQALTVVLGIFFTFAAAAYWVHERDRAVDLVTRLLPRPRRKKVRDTWDLVDAKLGAFVRGQLLLVALVASVISAAFWLAGEPYWLLLGVTTGLLELIPVIGPLAALAIVIAAGLTESWQVAAIAAAIVLGVRVLQDYLVTPRVLGGAVGLSPLIVLVAVFATGILFGGFYVLLAIPFAAALGTVIEVVALGLEPAEADRPTVLLTPGDTDG
jgi:predicted PurR-regulated permease PerM